MKKMVLIFFMVLIFSFYAASSSNNMGNRKQEIAKEIWALEEAYISYFSAANHKAILLMYHEQFLGWPDEEKQPAWKKDVVRYLKERYPEPIPVSFKIDRQGITILDDIAINHYLLTLIWKDKEGKEQKSTSRLTHTWIKTKKNWKILGGMSNRL
jgi:ketosteroid isomerase-like protein